MGRKLALKFLHFYKRRLSPCFTALGCHCRFSPTCSEYAMEAIEKHGLLKGSWLALKRLLRCNPLFPGGYDPVPDEIMHFSSSYAAIRAIFPPRHKK